MGSSLYLRLNILICGINQNNEELINRLFPEQLEDNKRKLYRKKIMYYTQQEYSEGRQHP